MSRATRLIKQLDKALSRHESFGDNPDSFVAPLLAEVKEIIQSLEQKSKPEHWAEIYVERDRARIKQEILNRIMAGNSD